jgi:toxin ParE1/3/4
MTTFSVEFAPEAADQLEALEEYIAGQGSPETASAYVEAIMAYCENLQSFAHRGTMRDDIRPGLRITNYGVFYGGQDYESILSVTSGH